MVPTNEPAKNNLRRLFALRNLEIAGQVLAVLIATLGLRVPLPLIPMGVVIGCFALANLLTWLRLKQTWLVTDGELFVQLLLDVTALLALLYLSGGSTNPFVSMFLLPLIVAAAALSWGFTWAMAGITLGCYTLLLFYYVPIGHPFPDPSLPAGILCHAPPPSHLHHMGGEDTFGLHILGMWFNYVVSALLVSLFVVKMAASLRERDGLLAAAREETLRNERIIALGTLAAGAAHELGTPLSTMAVVTKELQHEYADNPGLSENLAILRDQVANCKQMLSNLLASAGQARAEGGRKQPLDEYLNELVDKWQLMRPGATLTANWQGSQPAPRIISEQTLSQAIMNLLNNAADACPDAVEVHGKWTAEELFLDIFDRGPGLAPEALANAGKAFFTTKTPGQGIGIGLFLANATIERFGGSVKLFNRDGGGACTRVTLPLGKLIATGQET